MAFWNRSSERTAAFEVWSAEHGFTFDRERVPVAGEGFMGRAWASSAALDTATRGTTRVQTVLIRAGKNENRDLQVARVALRRGPATRMMLTTQPQGNARLLAPLAALAGFDHVHGVDDRLDRRWVITALDGTKAHLALAADRPLVDVLASVQPPSWHRWAKDDGPWAITLPETVAGWRNNVIDVEVGPDEVVVAVAGRSPDRRAAAVELAERLAAAIDGR